MGNSAGRSCSVAIVVTLELVAHRVLRNVDGNEPAKEQMMNLLEYELVFAAIVIPFGLATL